MDLLLHLHEVVQGHPVWGAVGWGGSWDQGDSVRHPTPVGWWTEREAFRENVIKLRQEVLDLLLDWGGLLLLGRLYEQ